MSTNTKFMKTTPPKLQLHLGAIFLYMNCVGKWDEQFIQNNYIPQMNAALEDYSNNRFVPVVNLKVWEIPGFNATSLMHQYHMELAERFSFHPVILIAPSRHLSLYEEVINDFKLAGTGAVAKAFEDYETAKNWFYEQEGEKFQLAASLPFQRSRSA